MALVDVDRTSWDKTKFCQPGQGYSVRTSAWPQRILLHTTNGRVGTSFEAEARYLATSPNVSAHYLVGKAGQVARFLAPKDFIAWHAGLTRWGWGNAATVGVEVHFTPGEGVWPDAMLDALGRLVLDLCVVYPIGRLETHMNTHRGVALPPGRKSDPSGMTDFEFTQWRQGLQDRRVAMLVAA